MVTRQSNRGSDRARSSVTVAMFNEKYAWNAYPDATVQAALNQAASLVEPYLSLENDPLFNSGSATGYVSYPGGLNAGVVEISAPFAAREIVSIAGRPSGVGSDFSLAAADAVVFSGSLSVDGLTITLDGDPSDHDLFVVTAIPRTMRLATSSMLRAGVLWYVGQPGTYADGRYWDVETGVYTFDSGVTLQGRSAQVYDPPAELVQRLEYYTGEVARVLLTDPTALSETSGASTLSGPARSDALRAVINELVTASGPSFGVSASSSTPVSTGTVPVVGPASGQI